MTMMCAQCYIEGREISPSMRNESAPPFAVMVYEGESRCKDHLPEGSGFKVIAAAPPMPAQFDTFVPVPENIQTDNRFIVDEGTGAKTPAKKTPAKRAPRKRTKS